MTARCTSDHCLPDPDYRRVRPDAAASVPHPGLGYDGYAFGDHEMLPTSAPRAVHDEVLRLREQYRHLVSGR